MTTKRLVTLAAIDQATTYDQLEERTGFSRRDLANIVQDLKASGFVTRQPGPLNQPAELSLTPAGQEEIERQGLGASESTVSRAIRVRPPLQTIWGEPCYFYDQGAAARAAGGH